MNKKIISTLLTISLLASATLLGGCSATQPTNDTTSTVETDNSTEQDSTNTNDTQTADSSNVQTADSSDTQTADSSDTQTADSNDTQTADSSNVQTSDSPTNVSNENTQLSAGTYTTTIGEKEVTLSGAYIVDGIDATITGGTYESTSSDQNVFLVVNGGSLTITDASIKKSGDSTQSDSTRTSDVSDDYNFYGLNSVVLVVGEGSSATINGCEVNSTSEGSNAIFATDSGKIDIDTINITTTGNSSRGLDATYKGTITANNVNISTAGAHCAPIATDRGGGTITVNGGSLKAAGDGSPCVYSTGDISVSNVTGVSEVSQAVVIEGKNSATLTNCNLTANGNNGVMMYQSMSGDAADSDAATTSSTLNLTDTTLTNNVTDGPMFYITNTSAIINCNNSTLENTSTTLITASAGNWGTEGSNGGSLTFNATNQVLSGLIEADSISSVNVSLGNYASFEGTTSGSTVAVSQAQ